MKRFSKTSSGNERLDGGRARWRAILFLLLAGLGLGAVETSHLSALAVEGSGMQASSITFGARSNQHHHRDGLVQDPATEHLIWLPSLYLRIDRAALPTVSPIETNAAETPAASATPAPAPSQTPDSGSQLEQPQPALLAPLSPRHLKLRGNLADPAYLDRAEWRLLSPDDPEFAEGRIPSGIARQRYSVALRPEGWPFPSENEHALILTFERSFEEGATYRLTHAGTGSEWVVDIDSQEQLSPSIHINQVGLSLLPHTFTEPSVYVSQWLVDLPPMTLSEDERRIQIVNARSHEVLVDGRLELRLGHDQKTEDAYETNYSQANVYAMKVDAPPASISHGLYYVRWPGVGRSFHFEIGEAVFDAAFETVFRALYHQRCGTALDPALTAFHHPICHTATVIKTNADYNEVGGDAFEALQREATGETFHASGGHHDAGDYDRRAEHLGIVDALVDLYEIRDRRDNDDDLDIPESGNGIPDILDEARWAIDLYVQLQDADAGGGVRAGIETTGYPGWETMPHEDVDTDWYAYAVDPATSYRFAGAATKLARNLERWDSADAERLQDRALRAWDWAEANPPSSYSVDHDAAYAAAELFKTTSEARFEAAFLARGPFGGGPPAFRFQDWDPDTHEQALWAYASSGAAASPAYAQAAKQALIERANRWIYWGKRGGHRMIKHPYAPVGYGSVTTPSAARALIRADALNPAPRYREWLHRAVDHSLGANAAGRSFITGLGPGAVRQPLQIPSMADGIPDPVPGIPVYGPSHETESQGILNSVLQAYEPSPGQWPLMERFVDVGYVPVLNEFTVQESIAPTVFVLGYLRDD